MSIKNLWLGSLSRRGGTLVGQFPGISRGRGPRCVCNVDDAWLVGTATRPDRRRGAPGLHRLDRIRRGILRPCLGAPDAAATPHPRRAGVASMSARLNPCRIFSQWVPAASPRTIRASFRMRPSRPTWFSLTIVEDDLRVLLVERAIDPCWGQWSLPSRLVRPGEDLEDAAARGLLAATGPEKEAVLPGAACHVRSP